MIKIVEKKKIWFSISLTVILLGLVLLFTRGLNFGIDFKGGTKLQIELGEKLDTAALDEIIKKYDSSASCKIVNNTQYEIKSTALDETTTSELLKEIKEIYPDKNIWCYTGYTYEKDLMQGGKVHTSFTEEMLSYIDILVDGRFIEAQKDITLKFRGSANQRILNLNER